jgi:hypothetical protein
MALGYEGWAKLKVGTTEELVLCTGASVPRARQLLESSSGYGGQIKTPVNEMGLGLPHNYDWVVWDGSINFEVHQDLLTNQLKPWIFDRQKAAEVTLKTRESNAQSFLKCYWNNISLTADEGSAVTGSLGFVSLDRDSYTVGGDYIANKEGDELLCNPGSLNIPMPLQMDYARAPVPFWFSTVNIDGREVEFVTWTLDYSQEVVKFFKCEANAAVQAPAYIAVGPMTVTFTGSYLIYATTPSPWTFPDTLSTLTVTIADEEMKMEDLESRTTTDAVQAPQALTPIDVEYAAYTLVA